MSARWHRVQMTALVATGSAAGALARLGLSMLVVVPVFGSLLVNVLGSALILFVVRYLAHSHCARLKLFITTGFCGGFTSLSSFSWEAVALTRALQPLSAGGLCLLVAFVVLSTTAWLGGGVIGWWLGGRALRPEQSAGGGQG